MTNFYARQQAVHIPGVPNLDHRHGVDGQRKLTVLKPLPPTSEGRKFELRNKVIGVYDKGKPGTVIETEQSIVDVESGEVYNTVLTSGFLVGQGGWGGPKGKTYRCHRTKHLLSYLNRPQHHQLPPAPRQSPRCHSRCTVEHGDCTLVPVSLIQPAYIELFGNLVQADCYQPER